MLVMLDYKIQGNKNNFSLCSKVIFYDKTLPESCLGSLLKSTNNLKN
jgi:hypothetical protein